MNIPDKWKRVKKTKKLEIFESEKYMIYLWKKRGNNTLETFRKAKDYKTRLFTQNFIRIRNARKFATNIMKRDRIRKY